jgi:cardiolipin synthase
MAGGATAPRYMVCVNKLSPCGRKHFPLKLERITPPATVRNPLCMFDRANLPNLLTWGRIAAIPLMVLCFYSTEAGWQLLAGVLFVAACITDYFDGHLARKWDVQSSFGRLLDPIADKILVAAALLVLVDHQQAQMLPSVIIISREILVSGLREFLAERRIPMPVSKLAKTKTGVQMTAISVLLLAAPLDPFFAPYIGPIAGDAALHYIGTALLWIAAILTLITGYHYWKDGIRHVD